MTPYATFYYFAIVAVLLAPTIIAGLRGKSLHIYNSIVTVIILAIVFASKPAQAVSLILFTIWQTALVIGYLRMRKRNNSAGAFYAAVVLSILPLVLAKVIPFFQLATPIGFLGISYLTFKTVQMIMEIRDGQIKEVSLPVFLQFLLFFPTITSGPIDRYRRYLKDVQTAPSREQYQDLLYAGLNRIFRGFLYKFIIGYLINQYVIQAGFVKEDTFAATLVYMYAYSLYLFFDFAGYSAFAVGVSYLMGIKTPENFNKPFLSRNIKDFWNRWHMSLSFWFRDYVYMRFVFFMTKKKIIKDRYAISYMGFFLNFFIMGIWHGLHIHYVIYGLYHALLFILFDLFERENKKRKFWPNNKWMHALAIIITFHAVCFGFLIFSGRLN
ncbi:D-alanyl-lipoteichoic acid biosynthesis protein DltB [Ectobacillus ponti]|uniref:Teichoic acid D-alanyltransferase n=1 Tax=Ectobacillus ponti TaxID=2961894 RepID=A0AA42BQK8_9BACI|nr:D-alanyl-lipoteichoic acid biosynthesis protein DltB [Ectobacillus ponti]MCP8968559.1 D-alanyl-lipoteichoic acid biosynthesis protein DltB [Ectobacillus ponti]